MEEGERPLRHANWMILSVMGLFLAFAFPGSPASHRSDKWQTASRLVSDLINKAGQFRPPTGFGHVGERNLRDARTSLDDAGQLCRQGWTRRCLEKAADASSLAVFSLSDLRGNDRFITIQGGFNRSKCAEIREVVHVAIPEIKKAGGDFARISEANIKISMAQGRDTAFFSNNDQNGYTDCLNLVGSASKTAILSLAAGMR